MLIIKIHIGAFISALKVHLKMIGIMDFELLARFKHLK